MRMYAMYEVIFFVGREIPHALYVVVYGVQHRKRKRSEFIFIFEYWFLNLCPKCILEYLHF